MRQFLDAAYVMMIEEMRQEGDTLTEARERVEDLFLSEREYIAKQNRKSAAILMPMARMPRR